MKATPKAPTELRECLRDRLFVPFPLNDTETADFTLYLLFAGVTLRFDKAGHFSADRDLCPFAWDWRKKRGEVA